MVNSAFSGARAMIRPYRGMRPKIGARVFIDASAQVVGSVELGDDSSVWMCSVVRGDVNHVRIGSRTSIQEGSILHVTAEHSLVVGDGVTVGHSVNLHGCTVGNLCLIGIGAIVLNGASIGEECIVAAGSLVPERMRVPARTLVMGSPARVRRAVTPEELEGLRRYAETYVGLKNDYLAEEATARPTHP
jgi:carbonic anhydrase/acetyltransferase-like protein (isoleucine patch superfamily)